MKRIIGIAALIALGWFLRGQLCQELDRVTLSGGNDPALSDFEDCDPYEPPAGQDTIRTQVVEVVPPPEDGGGLAGTESGLTQVDIELEFQDWGNRSRAYVGFISGGGNEITEKHDLLRDRCYLLRLVRKGTQWDARLYQRVVSRDGTYTDEATEFQFSFPANVEKLPRSKRWDLHLGSRKVRVSKDEDRMRVGKVTLAASKGMLGPIGVQGAFYVWSGPARVDEDSKEHEQGD